MKGRFKKRVRFEDSYDDDIFKGINNLFETKITDGERVDRRLEKNVSERDVHTFNSPSSEIHIACNLEPDILNTEITEMQASVGGGATEDIAIKTDRPMDVISVELEMQYDADVKITEETAQSMLPDETIQMPDETALPTFAELIVRENCVDAESLNKMRDKAETREEMLRIIKEKQIVLEERMHEIWLLLALRSKDNCEPDYEPSESGRKAVSLGIDESGSR